MSKTQDKQLRRQRAHRRVRSRLAGSSERPRLAVFKSNRFLYAQVIDDLGGRTLVQANSSEPGIRARLAGGGDTREAAKLVGETVAERAKQAGIARVVFDRAGYVYHGRVRELAESARAQGLEF
ncbi:MAG: 50S ribosomal protein L18 [Thermoanaerobaculia bacterium]